MSNAPAVDPRTLKLWLFGGGACLAALALGAGYLADRPLSELFPRTPLAVLVLTGCFALLMTGVPLRVVRSRVALPPLAPSRWTRLWLLSKLAVLVAVLLLVSAMAGELLLTGEVAASLRALALLLVCHCLYLLFGRSVANIAEIARRWPRAG